MGNLLSSLVFRPPTPPSYNINEIDRSPTTINPPSSTHSNVGICADSTSCFSQPNPSTPAFKSRIHRSLLPREDDDDEFPHVQQDTWHIKSFALKASARPSKFVKKYGDKITIVELPAGGTVCSIYFEHPKSRGITLIYSHGNAEDIGQLAPIFEELSKCLCVNLMAYDYRGYGQSKFLDANSEEDTTGGAFSNSDFKCKGKKGRSGRDKSEDYTTFKLNEQSVNEDLECIYAFVCLERGISSENVYLFGRSLGTSPSTHLASILTCGTPKQNIAKLANPMHIRLFERIRKWSARSESKVPLLGGLILQSPMKSCMKTKFDIGIDFFSKMSDDEEDSFDMFATERHITAVECPIFIVHGHKDRIVPCTHGKYLFKIATAARNARWALREKKKLLKEKEEGVMVWLMETKMKRREAKLRKQKEMQRAWSEANKEEVKAGTEYADAPAWSGGASRGDAISRRRTQSAPVEKKSTNDVPPATSPPPTAIYIVKGAGHNNVDKVAGLNLISEVRGFLIGVLRYKAPAHQRPLMTSPPPPPPPPPRVIYEEEGEEDEKEEEEEEEADGVVVESSVVVVEEGKESEEDDEEEEVGSEEDSEDDSDEESEAESEVEEEEKGVEAEEEKVCVAPPTPPSNENYKVKSMTPTRNPSTPKRRALGNLTNCNKTPGVTDVLNQSGLGLNLNFA